ncbi:MAG: SGNH/GDSL hydrolase family protein [Candidatus Omnitrophica bacterium]|nr:SGNH/GDSL hydrolase family protein [Candidatus Omnitrophota bacterium]
MKQNPSKAVLSILLGILLGLVFAETGLRVLWGESLRFNFFREGICQRHSVLGWVGKPGQELNVQFDPVDMADARIRINQDGFQDQEHSAEPQPGVKRVAFLGDSFTMGYGVLEEERFTDRIQRSLGPDWEVLNFGMWGYSTDQSLLSLREKVLRYQPDYVILCFFSNDILGNLLSAQENGLYLKPRFAFSKGNELVLKNVPVPSNRTPSALWNLGLSRWHALGTRLRLGKKVFERGWMSCFDLDFLETGHYDMTLRLLQEMAQNTRALGIRLGIVVIPSLEQALEEPTKALLSLQLDIPASRLALSLPSRAVLSAGEATQTPVLDLLPFFQAQRNPQDLYLREDPHWNARGHGLAAGQISAFLLQISEL